jgi:four helix bundle protein
MEGHRDLIAWQKAMDLVTEIYRVTRNFPKDELYGLVSQLRRAAVSVPSNIVEGYGRNSRKDFHRILGQALGSLLEVETQVEIARNLHYLSEPQTNDLLQRIRRVAQLLNGLKGWCESPVGDEQPSTVGT